MKTVSVRSIRLRRGPGEYRTSARARARGSQCATGFTLIEMLVVITIILVLSGLVLPAASTMWAQRKTASARTLLRGMLMTTRGRAVRASGTESGLFFFVDERGTQRIVSIEQDSDQSGSLAWENVFRITEDRVYALPAPLRVVPRYVVNEPVGGPDTPRLFSEAELAHDDLNALLLPDGNHAQRHRNFFAIVFSANGTLLVRRDVLILDVDADGPAPGDAYGLGDVTGLAVGYDHSADQAVVASYYELDDSVTDLDPTHAASPEAVPYLVKDADATVVTDNIALNFPSVDGLLLYDDSLFDSLETDAQKRSFLLETARPYYINRYTGAVIEGPVGESVASVP